MIILMRAAAYATLVIGGGRNLDRARGPYSKRDKPVEAAVAAAKPREPARDPATLKNVPELLLAEGRGFFTLPRVDLFVDCRRCAFRIRLPYMNFALAPEGERLRSRSGDCTAKCS